MYKKVSSNLNFMKKQVKYMYNTYFFLCIIQLVMGIISLLNVLYMKISEERALTGHPKYKLI